MSSLKKAISFLSFFTKVKNSFLNEKINSNQLDYEGAKQEYFQKIGNAFYLNWKPLVELREINSEFVCQGISKYEDFIIHTISIDNKRSSKILLFKIINDEKLKFICKLNLPKEATHTSDVTIFEEKIYFTDYHSLKIYEANLKDLLYKKTLIIENIYKTKIKNSGSISIFSYERKNYLIITSFLINDQMYFFDFDEFKKNNNLKSETSKDNNLRCLFSCKNSFFVQGLHFNNKKQKLFQTLNRFGANLIQEIDILKLIKSKNKYIFDCVEKNYFGPGPMIEDIILDSEKSILYTSDEYDNIIFNAKFENNKFRDYEKSIENHFKEIKNWQKLIAHKARNKYFDENSKEGVQRLILLGVPNIDIDIYEVNEDTKSILKFFSENKKQNQKILLDIKNKGFENQIFSLLEELNLLSYVMITSWDLEILKNFYNLMKGSLNKNFPIPLFYSYVREDSNLLLRGTHYFLSNLLFKKNSISNKSKLEFLKETKGGFSISIKHKINKDNKFFKKLKDKGFKVLVFGKFYGLKRMLKEDAINYIELENVDYVLCDNILEYLFFKDYKKTT